MVFGDGVFGMVWHTDCDKHLRNFFFFKELWYAVGKFQVLNLP